MGMGNSAELELLKGKMKERERERDFTTIYGLKLPSHVRQ
jgi:hypothetical protein